MDSLTKVPVTDADLAAMVRRGFGAGARVAECTELTDGTYNLAYLMRLADGPAVVLKVAPPPGMDLLTHEVDLMRTEVDFYRRAAAVGAPVPEVLYADLDRDLLGRDYVFLEVLAGKPLYAAAKEMSTVQLGAVRRQLGAGIARLHTATGDGYGYPLRQSGTWRGTWRESFLAMVDDILADGSRLGTELPEPAAKVAARFARNADLLDAVDRPALVHYDLWDGNVFVHPTRNGWRLSGMIDGERAFFGDPYAEFVSIALFRDIRQLPEILGGYAEAAGEPVDLGDKALRRITMYTCYLYLIMVTEGPTRGFDPVAHGPSLRRSFELLTERLATL